MCRFEQFSNLEFHTLLPKLLSGELHVPDAKITN
jgi:hypothetical protein